MNETQKFESRPLAQILRPTALADVIGQSHLVGIGGILSKMLTSQFVPSMIFWGPPGCGKTTLAELVSTLTKSVFVSKSAVTINGLNNLFLWFLNAMYLLHQLDQQWNLRLMITDNIGSCESHSSLVLSFSHSIRITSYLCHKHGRVRLKICQYV